MPSAVIKDDQLVKELYLSGMTTREIAKKLGGRNHQPIIASLRRSGTPLRKEWKRASGPENGKWNGGVKVIKGYRHLLLPNHPMSRPSDGYVAEHRLLVAEALGRMLSTEEIVNHIDRNPLNNSLSNLELFPTNGAHISMHVRTTFNRNPDGTWAPSSRSFFGEDKNA